MIALPVATIVVLAGGAGAQSLPDDKAALAGLKEVKAAYDITQSDPKRLLAILDVIEETRASLIQQGVTPHLVLTFRGPATVLVSDDAAKIKPEDRETVATIAARVKQLRSAPGIDGLEQCNVALRLAGVARERVRPEVSVVGNSWISLMAYQARGYAYIAP
jgi:intracellular sulfur oxidation DsrE/DsrF family protein